MLQERTSIAALLAVIVAVTAGCAPASQRPNPRPTDAPDHRRSAVAETPAASAERPETPQRTVRLAFAGDTYAEGPLQWRLTDDPNGFVGPFARVLRKADVAMANLETAITTSTSSPDPKAFNFASPAAILPALHKGGIDVVTMANNHGMDYGYPGLRDSLRAQRRSDGPAIIGIGPDAEAAYAPYVAEVGGQRIAFFTASQVLDPHLEAKWTAGRDKPGLASAFQLDTLTDRIRSTRPTVDTVVVFLHWGIETTTCPVPEQVDLAHRLKQAGADVIVGGGQHRIAGGGKMGQAVVNYGLGNFLFQAASSESDRTGVFVVDVRGRQIIRSRWLPGRIVGAVPRPLHGADRRSEWAYWNSLRSCTGLR